MLTAEFITLLQEFIMVIPHISHMNQSFHRIGKFYVHAPFCHAGDNSFILFSNMILHVFRLLQPDNLALGFVRRSLPAAALSSCFG